MNSGNFVFSVDGPVGGAPGAGVVPNAVDVGVIEDTGVTGGLSEICTGGAEGAAPGGVGGAGG